MDDALRYARQTSNFLFSSSGLERLLRCGIWWLFDRESRHDHATVRMLVGTGTHAGAAASQEHWLRHAEPASMSDTVARSVSAYEERIRTSEVPDGKHEREVGVDATAEAARGYTRELAADLHPIQGGIERKIIAEIAPGIELAGTLDHIGAGVIRDLKVGQPWQRTRADRERKLTGYTMLYEAAFGRLPERVAIDSLSEQRGRYRAETLWSERTERDRQAFVRTAQCAKSTVESGTFLPAPDGAWWCSQKWCPHWARCTYRPGA